MLEGIRVIAVPPVSLSLEVELGLGHQLVLDDHLVLREVPLIVLDAHLPGSLRARLHIVSHRPAVGARPLPVFSDLLGLHATAVPGVVDGRFDPVVACPLMGQHFLVLLLQVPRCLLDILRHVGQVKVWCLFRRFVGVPSSFRHFN